MTTKNESSLATIAGITNAARPLHKPNRPRGAACFQLRWRKIEKGLECVVPGRGVVRVEKHARRQLRRVLVNGIYVKSVAKDGAQVFALAQLGILADGSEMAAHAAARTNLQPVRVQFVGAVAYL